MSRTSTSNFGVSRREGHDSSGFYARFRPPELSDDDTIAAPRPIDEPLVVGDSRRMDRLEDASVALVVTSPPYFAGKQYEEELGRDGTPGSYVDYLQMLRDVFAECRRVLEPGGRIAVNVANLGRKPFRSLAADIISILQDDLGLLLRGEIVWQKGEGAAGSCAWGSFRSPTNPVLRDITERVIIASKDRFDRALTVKERKQRGLPHQATVNTEDFMALTLDLWMLPTESARRVGHPAPFPVELPEQLIRLYTFADDLVVDPFLGSGSTAVAASRLGRRYVGYDLDPNYIEIARRRVKEEGQPLESPASESASAVRLEGPVAKEAEAALVEAGFTVVRRDHRVRGTGVAIGLLATDVSGDEWWFDLAGANTTYRGGLLRTEIAWRALGRAHAVRAHREGRPLVLLTTAVPPSNSPAGQALRAAGPDAITDVIDLTSAEARNRLARYAREGTSLAPRPGFWSRSTLTGT